MLETLSTRRGHTFIPEAAALWPSLYSTENITVGDKEILAHYFVGGSDWYLTEYDGCENLAFGYVNLGSEDGEWGSFSLEEMEQVIVHGFMIIERDLDWEAKSARTALPSRAWIWGDK